MNRKTFFADILLPLPLQGTFTYRIPQDLEQSVAVGKRVVVPFGKHKVYAGVVKTIHENAPKNYIVKYIQSVIDEKPVVNQMQFRLWEWIADYYLCCEGEVMQCALPSAFRLSGETSIIINPEFDGDITSLNENEIYVTQALHTKPELTIDEISQITGLQKTLPLINTLREKGVILVKEEVGERYKPKIISQIKLSENYENDEEALKKLLDTLEKKAPKQVDLMMFFLAHTIRTKNDFINKSELIEKSGVSGAILQSLIKKNIFIQYETIESRLEKFDKTDHPDTIELSEIQKNAFTEIKKEFDNKPVVLLHGVTSSGKTEIYIKLIEEIIQQGKQVLYLLPEIALTSQIINRLRKYFGDNVGIYHSRYGEHERAEVWKELIHSHKYQIVLGARSALFLPFDNLGLVIVDEEHETSFKQYDPAPRYHARDTAIYLAHLHNAKTLLGSATPSLESYYNAIGGKYGLVEIAERFGGVLMPEILIADLKIAAKNKNMHAHFSSMLIEKMDDALKNKEQIILFQNRRGFSLRLECDVCNYMPECINCDVTLTYHKHSNQLKCHYCGLSTAVPEKCPKCGNTSIKMHGFGTEKIEDDLSIFFPDARVSRMDYDTTRSKNAYTQIISDFEDKKIDILVGTQMVTKGLDFDNVSVVGILNADNMISFPDFRSHERSFQLMEQVSGRAGRKNKQGMVVIQSYNPSHPIIQNVVAHDYQAMFQQQIAERKTYKYPPFVRLLKLTLKHKNPELLHAGAFELATMLRNIFKTSVLGPEFPLVSRIQQFYLKDILLKIDRRLNVPEQKKIVQNILFEFSKISKYKSIRVIVDVDPS